MAAGVVSAAFVACLERPRDLSLAREYLRVVREQHTRESADVCQIGTLVVDRRQELPSDERTCLRKTSDLLGVMACVRACVRLCAHLDCALSCDLEPLRRHGSLARLSGWRAPSVCIGARH